MSPLTEASKFTIVHIQLVYVTTYRSLEGHDRIYTISVCHHLQKPQRSQSYICNQCMSPLTEASKVPIVYMQLVYVTTYRSLIAHDRIYNQCMSPLTEASKVTIVYIQLVYVTTDWRLNGHDRIYNQFMSPLTEASKVVIVYIQLVYVTIKIYVLGYRQC